MICREDLWGLGSGLEKEGLNALGSVQMVELLDWVWALGGLAGGSGYLAWGFLLYFFWRLLCGGALMFLSFGFLALSLVRVFENFQGLLNLVFSYYLVLGYVAFA